jgi:peptidoglycan/LPS O-acetylase OafA/YrhL
MSMSTQSPSPRSDGHEQYLDLLRGVAIIETMLVHFANGWTFSPSADPTLRPLLNSGQHGVRLFFFLSAFTLALSWNRKAQTTAQFFVRRFFRIVPLYWAAILVSLVVSGFGPRNWLGTHKTLSGYDIGLNALLLHWSWPWAFNSVVPGGWSLAVEATFYACFPLLIRYTSKRLTNTILLLGLTLVLGRLLTVLLVAHPLTDDGYLWDNFMFMYPPAQFPFFIFGLLAFQMAPRLARELSVVSSYVLLVLSLAALTLYGLGELEKMGLPFPFHGVYGLALPFITLTICLPGVVAHASSSWAARQLIFAPLASLGKSCYSIYLFHFFIIDWLHDKNPHWLLIQAKGSGFISFALNFALCCAAMGLVGFVLRTQIEERLIRWGRRIEKRIAPAPLLKPVMATAAPEPRAQAQ